MLLHTRASGLALLSLSVHLLVLFLMFTMGQGQTTSPTVTRTVTRTSTASLFWSPSRTPTPTVTRSATRSRVSLSGTPTRAVTPTSSASPSRLASPSISPSRTVGFSPSVTTSRTPSLSSTRSQSCTPTIALLTPSSSPTMTTSQTSSMGASLSSTPSVTETLTGTVTGTGSASDTPTFIFTTSDTPSTSPTSSSLDSASPTFTPTPTTTSTPPLNSCLSSVNGCSISSLTSLPPQVPSGATLPTLPATLIASWPFLSASALFTLPTLPSPGETLTLQCDISPPTAAIVSLNSINTFSSLCSTPSSLSQLCITFSSSSAASYSPQSLQLLVTPLPPNSSASTTTTTTSAFLSCVLNSLPVVPRDLSFLPHYGTSSELTLPLFLPISSSLLLRSILAESRIVPGTFRIIAGEGVGESLRPIPPSTFSIDAWNNATVATTPSLLAPLISLVASLNSTVSTTPWFSTTLSGQTHLLLSLVNNVTSSNRLFSSNTNVTLNGHPCMINWISPDNSLASITTPTYTTLCGDGIGDCGDAILLLSEGIDPFETFLLQLTTTSSILSIPATYPPLLPPIFTLNNVASGQLLGLPMESLLITAAALMGSNDGVGVHLASACIDPSFAPPEMCALVGGFVPPPPPNRTTCAYGAGDSCTLCPTERAICPGGTLLLPLPGHWAPSPNSPPSDLLACPEPDSLLRCPGSRDAAGRSRTNKCGLSFRGTACSGCRKGFFPSAGSCEQCPQLSVFVAQLLPLVKFASGLILLGVFLLSVAQTALLRKHKNRPTSLFKGLFSTGGGGAIFAVGTFLIWTWGGAQTMSALFSQTLNAGVVPLPLTGFFSAISALQFVGVTLAPACYESIPFVGFWACFGVVCVSVFCGIMSLVIQNYVSTPESFLLRGAKILLYFSVILITTGYGAFISNATDTVTCRLPTMISVADYARAISNGKALSRAYSGSGSVIPSIETLRQAADDPFFAAQRGLTSFLRNTIPVSLLASDSYIVCGEGVQAVAQSAAITLLIFLIIGLPSLAFTSLWCTGRLKGLRRMWVKILNRKRLTNVDKKTAVAGEFEVMGETPTPLITPHVISTTSTRLAAVFEDSSLHSRAAWLPMHGWLLTAACTGATALSTSATTLVQFYVLQTSIIIITLASSILIVWLKPFKNGHHWKAPALSSLYFISMIAALFNIIFRVYSGRGTVLSWGLCLTLFLLAGATFILSLAGWFHALVISGDVVRSVQLEAPIANETIVNPLLIPAVDEKAITKTTNFWQRVASENGEYHWFCAETGLTAVNDSELPIGALTVDGYELCGEDESNDIWWKDLNRNTTCWHGPWVEIEAALRESARLAALDASRLSEAEEEEKGEEVTAVETVHVSLNLHDEDSVVTTEEIPVSKIKTPLTGNNNVIQSVANSWQRMSSVNGKYRWFNKEAGRSSLTSRRM